MNVYSEKEMYEYRLPEEFPKYEPEFFVWCEELSDKKIIVYSGGISHIPDYSSFKNFLTPCGLVIVDFHDNRFLRFVNATLNIVSGDAYISKDVFNKEWKALKKGLRVGIRLAEQEEILLPAKKPEDIVVLDLLNKEGSRAVIEGNTIVYKQIGLTEEEKRQYGRKQSLLDDPKMFYFYSENGEYYHDKECQEIKGIMPEDFQGSDTIPDNKEICPKCRRKIYFRKATYPNTKQSSICNRIF